MDQRYRIYVQIDLNEGCLQFDPFGNHVLIDDGTAVAADRIADDNEFIAEVLGNGRVQLIERGSEYLIAEARAYIPTNMFLDIEQSRSTTDGWRRIAQERRDAASSTRNE